MAHLCFREVQILVYNNNGNRYIAESIQEVVDFINFLGKHNALSLKIYRVIPCAGTIEIQLEFTLNGDIESEDFNFDYSHDPRYIYDKERAARIKYLKEKYSPHCAHQFIFTMKSNPTIQAKRTALVILNSLNFELYIKTCLNSNNSKNFSVQLLDESQEDIHFNGNIQLSF